MGLPWIKVHSNLRRHPKTLALADAVEQDHAWCYLVALWSWAAEFCPGGVLRSRGVPRLVEREADWRGESGALFRAMVDTGWLSVDGDSVTILGWEEYQLPHIQHAAREAARQKSLRERSKALKAAPSASDDVDRTEERTRTDTRTVVRPDRDRDREEDKELSTLALFADAKGAGDGAGAASSPEKKTRKRGRPAKAVDPEAQAEVASEKADADAWMLEARKLTGLSEDELRWSRGAFMAFRQQRKTRGMEQLLRALEGLRGDPFSKTAGLGWLVSDNGITKGLARWKKEAATLHPNRNWDDGAAKDLDSWL